MIDYQDLAKLKIAYIQKNQELAKILKEYPKAAEKMAKKEQEYLVAKAQAILTLKEQKQQTTLIPALAKGMVADERFKHKVAESLFHVCRERIKALHANLDAYRSLLSTAKREIDIR